MGSRYGGLKQVEPVGRNGETIIDYCVYDAIRAGFGRVVFVIRHDIEADFKQVVAGKFIGRVPLDYAFQELAMVPKGCMVPNGRKKPWGTGHAILAAESVIGEPFAMINADDFYGADSFRVLCKSLETARSDSTDYAMVGFTLRNTLSEHGAVTRGVCEVDEHGMLRKITELYKIERVGDAARHADERGQSQTLSGDEPVSMNCWGFTPALFGQLREQFRVFVDKYGQDEKAEFLIPSVVNTLVNAGQASVRVLPTQSQWFGITYREDLTKVRDRIRQLIAFGDYPEKLWS